MDIFLFNLFFLIRVNLMLCEMILECFNEDYFLDKDIDFIFLILEVKFEIILMLFD